MSPTTKKQLIIVATLTGFNLLLSGSFIGDGQSLDGHLIESHSPEMRRAALVTNLFGIPFISFILGLMVGGIPYQKKAYNEKVVYFSLGIIIIIQSFFLIAGIVKLVLMWTR
jgi:hypothetical protein